MRGYLNRGSPLWWDTIRQDHELGLIVTERSCEPSDDLLGWPNMARFDPGEVGVIDPNNLG